MKPIGIDLGTLRDRKDDGMSTPFVHSACPGARVLVTRFELTEYKRGGEEFIAEETFVPAQGYGYARVRCGRPVDRWKGSAGHVVYGGTCHSCGKLEADNRKDLRVALKGKQEAAE